MLLIHGQLAGLIPLPSARRQHFDQQVWRPLDATLGKRLRPGTRDEEQVGLECVPVRELHLEGREVNLAKAACVDEPVEDSVESLQHMLMPSSRRWSHLVLPL